MNDKFMPSESAIGVACAGKSNYFKDSWTLFCSANGCTQQAAKFPREIHRYPGVHRALLVKEALGSRESEYALVPNIGVDVQSMAAVKAKTDEILGSNIVARQCEGHHEWPTLQREEQLAPVGVVIGMPQQHAMRIAVVAWIGIFR